jgi:hypothetical protein
MLPSVPQHGLSSSCTIDRRAASLVAIEHCCHRMTKSCLNILADCSLQRVLTPENAAEAGVGENPQQAMHHVARYPERCMQAETTQEVVAPRLVFRITPTSNISAWPPAAVWCEDPPHPSVAVLYSAQMQVFFNVFLHCGLHMQTDHMPNSCRARPPMQQHIAQLLKALLTARAPAA